MFWVPGVVQDDQDLPAMKHAAEQRSSFVECAWYLLTGDAKRAQELLKRSARRQWLLVRVVATKIGIELTAGKPVHRTMAPVQGQPCLPNPGYPGDDPDPKRPVTGAVGAGSGHRGELVECLELRAAPDEAPDIGRQLGRHRQYRIPPGRRRRAKLNAARMVLLRGWIARLTGQRALAPGWLVPQQGLVNGTQLRPGLDAQRLDQLPSAVVVHGQRLGPAPGLVQRQHELAAEPLAERMCPHQGEQVTHQFLVMAKIQFQGNPFFGNQQSPFLQPGGLDLGEWPVDAVQRRAAP